MKAHDVKNFAKLWGVSIKEAHSELRFRAMKKLLKQNARLMSGLNKDLKIVMVIENQQTVLNYLMEERR